MSTTKICCISKCGRPINSRGLCHKHYHFFRTKGLFATKTCTREGCDEGFYARGLCSSHYREVQKAENNERAKHNAGVLAAMHA